MKTSEQKQTYRREYMREWTRKNKEKVNENRRKHWLKRKESDPNFLNKHNERSRNYYSKNKESIKEWGIQYRRKHPVAKAMYRANWFSKKAGIEGELILKEVEELFEEESYTCSYCSVSPVYAFDHIIATSRGGLNLINNITPCCQRCNSSKKAADVDDWISGIKPTHCRKGHLYDDKNTYIQPDNGSRDCKACHNLAVIKHLNSS